MNALTPEQREIAARLQSGRLMICDGQGDPNSDGCGGQGYTGAAGQEPCPHCYGAGVMTPELQAALASAPSPEAGAGGDLGAWIEDRLACAQGYIDLCANNGTDNLYQKGRVSLLRELQVVLASTGSGEETKGADEPFQPKIETCPKCQAQGVAFICDQPGCPVNGGAAYPWTPRHSFNQVADSTPATSADEPHGSERCFRCGELIFDDEAHVGSRAGRLRHARCPSRASDAPSTTEADHG